MAIPDVYGERIEERIEILKLIVRNGSGGVGLIFQILASMSKIRRILPFVYWSIGINDIDGIDDMIGKYGALISAGVTSLHFRGIPQDEIVRALQWDNDELERREAIPECLEFRESKILSMLN